MAKAKKQNKRNTKAFKKNRKARQPKGRLQAKANKFQTSSDSWQMYKATNPFTGAVSILTQEQADALKKIKQLEYKINVVHANDFDNAEMVYKMIDEFDELRYEFAEKWSDIYMEQLD